MRRKLFLRKMLVGGSLLLAGGTVMGNGCINTLASVNPCGTVFTFCQPVDWLNVWYPMLEVPDFSADPSCTIPLGCGDGDLYPALEGGPGGDSPEEPSDTQGGGTGGGGGGI